MRDVVGVPTPNIVRANKPVRVAPSTPVLHYYSVEQVNIQMDEHRWWSIAIVTTRDEAIQLLGRYRTEDPDGIYRVIEATQIA